MREIVSHMTQHNRTYNPQSHGTVERRQYRVRPWWGVCRAARQRHHLSYRDALSNASDGTRDCEALPVCVAVKLCSEVSKCWRSPNSPTSYSLSFHNGVVRRRLLGERVGVAAVEA